MTARPRELPDGPDAPGDAELVERTLTGSTQAFGLLVQRHEPLVRGLARRFARGEAEAQDVVQDVFLRAFDRLATLREPARLRPWLARLAVQRGLALGRRRRVETAALPRLAREEATTGVAPEATEERARLLAALDELPADARAVVVLRYLEGLDAPRIADALGLSPEAVRQRLSRALRLLRERLA